jgi:peroxiredoxin
MTPQHVIGEGAFLPDVALVDHTGRPWRFSDHRGRPLLLVLHRHLA